LACHIKLTPCCLNRLEVKRHPVQRGIHATPARARDRLRPRHQRNKREARAGASICSSMTGILPNVSIKAIKNSDCARAIACRFGMAISRAPGRGGSRTAPTAPANRPTNAATCDCPADCAVRSGKVAGFRPTVSQTFSQTARPEAPALANGLKVSGSHDLHCAVQSLFSIWRIFAAGCGTANLRAARS